jgi:hypothetical protein
MNRWLKIFLLIVQIGGGLLGIGIVGRVFLGQDLNKAEMIICAAFVILFAFGILAGTALIWKPKLGLILSLIFQAIQIPVIITPVVSFILSAGVFWNVFRHESGWGTRFTIIGSRFYFYLNRNEPTCIGVNLVALTLFILLIREIWFIKAAQKVERPESSNIPDQPILSAGWRGS